MEYKKVEKKNYNLYITNTERFKSISIMLNFRKLIDRKNITKANILKNILKYSCKKYNTKNKIIIKMQDLYGLAFSINLRRVGKYLNIEFFFNFLNPKYTELEMFNETFDFIKQVIFCPDVKNKVFNKDTLKIIKELYKTSLIDEENDKQRLAIKNMLKILGGDKEFTIPLRGSLEDIDKINEENLYSYYKNIINNSAVDIFVVGDVIDLNIDEQIKTYFPFKKNPKLDISPFIDNSDLLEKKEEEIIKYDNINQSKLAMGCILPPLNNFEGTYVLFLYDYILGNVGDSKLFKTIREKYSYAYYVDSFANKFDGIFIIRAGISKENYNNTVIKIKEEMASIVNGDFSLDDIKSGQTYYINNLNQIDDHAKSIMEVCYGINISKSDTPLEKREKIMKVTKDDIINLAKKINLKIIYLLEEDKNERN